MKNKHTLLLLSICLFTFWLPAQTSLKLPFFQGKKQSPADVTKSLYLKTAVSNLIHPTAPSLDVGFEIARGRQALELMYGIKTRQLVKGWVSNERKPLDSYHKIFLSYRKYQTDRIASAAKRALFYWGGSIYASWGKDLRENDFAIDKDRNRLEYYEASLDKKVWGFNFIGGIIFSFTNRIGLEYNAGVGYLYINRFYTLIGVQRPIPNINVVDVFTDSYNDRNLGSYHLPNIILNLKCSVRIY